MIRSEDNPKRYCPVCGYYLKWEERLVCHLEPSTGRVFRHLFLRTTDQANDWWIWSGWDCYRKVMPDPRERLAKPRLHGQVLYTMFAF